jgi:trk system potassium uptake protein TrkH
MSERANPQTLALLSEPDRWFHAVFQSVSARTAGFNTIDLTSATQAGMVSIIALMFVGGSPGSTSGGVKTTTFGIVMAALWSHLCGREDVEVFRRRIPRPQTQRAFLIVAMSVAIMIVGLILMTLAGGYHPPSGRDPLMPLAFEVVSGFCTVGYSSGASSELNSLSKVVMCALMFAGRLGPLTLAVAVISERKAPLYRLPAESVMVG